MIELRIHDMSKALVVALKQESRRRGLSVDETVLELLRIALGLSEEPLDNGLGRFAGTWSEEEFQEFEANVRGIRDFSDSPT